MPNDERSREDERHDIGLRLRAARAALPDDESRLKNLVASLGLNVSESLFSQFESGTKPLPAEVLARFVKVTGVPPHRILSDGEPEDDEPDFPFTGTIQFLQAARELGILGLYPDRDAGLVDLEPFARRMVRGRICITGSSLNGLRPKGSDLPIIRLIRQYAANPRIVRQVILTHPLNGDAREELENRPPNSIRGEILEGIRWCLESLKIPKEHIRLIRASPCTFSLFLDDGVNGRGLVNTYPLRRQSFTSFTLLCKKVRGSPRGVSVYQTYYHANFEEAWNDSKLTVPLETGLDECLRSEALAQYQATIEQITKMCRQDDQE